MNRYAAGFHATNDTLIENQPETREKRAFLIAGTAVKTPYLGQRGEKEKCMGREKVIGRLWSPSEST